MHYEIERFVRQIKLAEPSLFRDKRVLEIGSAIVNGSIRDYFTDCTYLGVDWRKADGVNRVCFGHQVEGDWDVIVCSETLEHDTHAIKTFHHVRDHSHQYILTCAIEPRIAHRFEFGVNRHYANIPLDWFAKLIQSESRLVEIDRLRGDIRIWGWGKLSGKQGKA